MEGDLGAVLLWSNTILTLISLTLRELATSLEVTQSQETKPISPKSFSSMTLKGFRDMICEYVIRVLQFFKTNLLGTGMIAIQFHQQQGHF